MPKFLEDKLKAEYGAKSKTPYKVMNAIGAMKGNKETKKGARMEAKHERDEKAGKASGHPHKNLGKYLHPKKGGK